VRPDEAVSQLAFASSPWPDLPRRASDRRPNPHHPDPAPHNQNGTWSGSRDDRPAVCGRTLSDGLDPLV